MMTRGYYQQIDDMSQFASGVYFYELRVRGENGVLFRNIRTFVIVKWACAERAQSAHARREKL
jgi:hypothetical protein